MGMWIELGIFVVVLIWAIWQWRDARQALERTRAAKAREAAEAQAQGRDDQAAPRNAP